MITILSGGTGSIKLVRGLASIDEELVIIANVGDNFSIYDLYIAPDLDIILYGLSGFLDEERRWGVKGDTFNFLNQMDVFGEDSWFNIGDKDLAMHIYRTHYIQKGLTLSEITDKVREKLGIKIKIIPASNDVIQTKVQVQCGEIHFQEYWVRNKAKDKVLGIRYDGSEIASAAPGVIKAIMDSELVIICPANPITSIGPILSVSEIRESLKSSSAYVSAISPIIDNNSVSGPAAKLMGYLGMEVNALGVARLYSDFLNALLIHNSDAYLKNNLVVMGIRPFVTDILMRESEDEIRLAKFIVEYSRRFLK